MLLKPGPGSGAPDLKQPPGPATGPAFAPVRQGLTMAAVNAANRRAWNQNDCGAATDCGCPGAARDAEKGAVGQLVKFPVNTIHGKGTMSGTVKLVLPDGRLEIKGQNGGYYKVRPEDLV